MTMSEWAAQEIAIAKSVNAKDDPYSIECYDAALEVYKVFCAQGHSGLSAHLTIDILTRLLNMLPLTPIEDTDDIWQEFDNNGSEVRTFQCTRRPSLFKMVDKNGTVSYRDMDQFLFRADNGSVWQSGFVSKICQEYCPITFPYIPVNYDVFGNSFLVDPKNGDYDTIAIYGISARNACGEIPVNRYFADVNGEMTEISKKEYNERYAHRIIKEEK